jgi:prepilin-type N-terminal cleavage/methylation domain-containing protein
MNNKKNKGFTIMEMVVTLAIMAIMFTLSLSMGRSTMQRGSFVSAYNQFLADFYYARQLASTENKYVAMVFDPLGKFYSLRIQSTIDTDLKDDKNYFDLKKVEPMGSSEKPFFSGATDFAINSTGTVRSYPVDVDSDPISVSITFFKKNESTDEIDFQKKIWIYPSGGIKIEK